MTASLACQCHVLPKENGRILPFTATSWTKFVECTSKWRVLDAEKEKEVAELAHHVISNYSKSNVDLHVRSTNWFGTGRLGLSQKLLQEVGSLYSVCME